MEKYVILDKIKHKYISIHNTWYLAYKTIEDMCKQNKYLKKRNFEILRTYIK